MLKAHRTWNRRTADSKTNITTNRNTVKSGIAKCTDRDARMITPPVDTEFYYPAPVRREDYYLAVSAFAPYKRLDLAITACNRLGRHLVIIGTGQDEARLRRLAGPTVHFLGWQPDEAVRDHLRRCPAL